MNPAHHFFLSLFFLLEIQKNRVPARFLHISVQCSAYTHALTGQRDFASVGSSCLAENIGPDGRQRPRNKQNKETVKVRGDQNHGGSTTGYAATLTLCSTAVVLDGSSPGTYMCPYSLSHD